jgi:aryl-alcohol dehydrogenase-like predicted oxidoreductase
VERIRFGRTGQSISRIAVGTWAHGGAHTAGEVAVGWGGHDDEAARSALEVAHADGLNHWDTADGYGGGRAERLIGSLWSRVPRDEVFLATKVGWVKGPYPHYYHPEQVRRQLEMSLANLATDCIDLYYLHHCDFGPDDRHLDAALEVVLRAREEGKIRFIGLSDWSSRKIVRLAARVDPDVVQPYRNVLDDDYLSSGLATLVMERDLGVAFFSPLKHGLLLGKYSQPAAFEAGDMRSRVPGFADPDLLARLRRARRQVEERIDHPHPVLHALVDTLLTDSPSASVLLGQRNPSQARAAATLGQPLDAGTAEWVRSIYRL